MSEVPALVVLDTLVCSSALSTMNGWSCVVHDSLLAMHWSYQKDNSCHICESRLRMKMIRYLICIQSFRQTDVRFIPISRETTTLIFVKDFFFFLAQGVVQ